MIYLGADHAGYDIKETVKKLLEERGEPYTDLSPDYDEKDDYPKSANLVANAVVKHHAKGILCCRSGIGMTVAANKTKGARAGLVWNAVVAEEAKKDVNINIIGIPAGFITKDQTEEIVMTFLDTPFSSAERHLKRIKMISEIENKEEGCLKTQRASGDGME